jgi:hypothetical protein
MFSLNKTELIAARIASILAVLVFFAWISRGENEIKDGAWHFYSPSDPVVVSDGTEVSGIPIMSRWNDSAWEYRQMTQDEKVGFNDFIGGPPIPKSSRP